MGADKVTGEIVALKRINTEEEANGFPITALREVKLLKALRHDNIVKLKEVATSRGTLFGINPKKILAGSSFRARAPHLTGRSQFKPPKLMS
mmetsp:Transcript_24352/g.46646  ORF Transcript_24352/g.46646 Transcript_24352/m.46646 type:complete len:92 (+) Transcript_24352:1218-1493(+)